MSIRRQFAPPFAPPIPFGKTVRRARETDALLTQPTTPPCNRFQLRLRQQPVSASERASGEKDAIIAKTIEQLARLLLLFSSSESLFDFGEMLLQLSSIVRLVVAAAAVAVASALSTPFSLSSAQLSSQVRNGSTRMQVCLSVCLSTLFDGGISLVAIASARSTPAR